MKNFSLLVFLGLPLYLTGQNQISFQDTSLFKVFIRLDTVAVSLTGGVPKPDSLKLDVDCDGMDDLILISFTTPLTNGLPPAQNIGIQNIAGANFETVVYYSSVFPKAFRANDVIHIDSIQNWKSTEYYYLMYYNWINGAVWSGVTTGDSVKVSNMYILYRKKIEGTYRYGWLQYSGIRYPATIYLHSIAFDKEFCEQAVDVSGPEANPEIKIFPNPTANTIHIDAGDLHQKPTTWQIFNASGQLLLMGILDQKITEIDLSPLGGADGVLLIHIVQDDKIVKSQKLLKF